MFDFFELRWIFSLKAVLVLNSKNIANQKKIFVQLRQFFSLKSVSVL